jgi:hypothetical protein
MNMSDAATRIMGRKEEARHPTTWQHDDDDRVMVDNDFLNNTGYVIELCRLLLLLLLLLLLTIFQFR